MLNLLISCIMRINVSATQDVRWIRSSVSAKKKKPNDWTFYVYKHKCIYTYMRHNFRENFCLFTNKKRSLYRKKDFPK